MSPAASDIHPLRAHLLAVCEALQNPQMLNRVQSPSVAAVAPVAATHDIAALENLFSLPLPKTVIAVLTRVSAEICFAWALSDNSTLEAPEPFLSHVPGFPPVPRFEFGNLVFGLKTVAQLAADVTPEYWPIFTHRAGDYIAIDLSNPDERLILISHDDAFPPFVFDLNLPQFLTHLTWLGPLCGDQSVMNFFSDTSGQFDAQSERGVLWRNWFWKDISFPKPDDSLLTRL